MLRLAVFFESELFCFFAEALSAEVDVIAADVRAVASTASTFALADASCACAGSVVFDEFLFLRGFRVELFEYFAIVFGRHS